MGLVRHSISLPKVIALTKLIESIVDIIMAKRDTIKMPKSPDGSTLDASIGYAIRGFSGAIKINAYKPAVIVRMSNINQMPIEIISPFLAFSGLSTDEHR